MPDSVDFSDTERSSGVSLGAQLLFSHIADPKAVDQERLQEAKDEALNTLMEGVHENRNRRGHGHGKLMSQSRKPIRRHRSFDDDDDDDDDNDHGSIAGQFSDSEDDDSEIQSKTKANPKPKSITKPKIRPKSKAKPESDLDFDQEQEEQESEQDPELESDNNEYEFAGVEEVPLPPRDHEAYEGHHHHRRHHHRYQPTNNEENDNEYENQTEEEPIPRLPKRDTSPEATRMRRQALLMRLRDLITNGYTPTHPEAYFSDESQCGEDELGFEVSYGEKYLDREQWVTWLCQGLLLGFNGFHKLNSHLGPFIHTDRLPARARASQSKFSGPLREIYDRHIAGSGPSNPFLKLGMAVGMVIVANHFAEEDEINRERGVPSATENTTTTTTGPATNVQPPIDPIFSHESSPNTAQTAQVERPLLEDIAD